MNVHRLALLILGIFLLLYGFQNATNFEIVWMNPVCALSALVAGALFLGEVFFYRGDKV